MLTQRAMYGRVRRGSYLVWLAYNTHASQSSRPHPLESKPKISTTNSTVPAPGVIQAKILGSHLQGLRDSRHLALKCIAGTLQSLDNTV